MKHHFLAMCLSTPWALRHEVMSAYAGILSRRFAVKEGLVAGRDGSGPEDEVGHGTPIAAARGGSPARAGSGSIAVIPIRGTIVQRADMLDLCEGGTSTEDIAQALRMAMADDTVGQILLHIHSPGGSVYGVSELFDEIRSARDTKPVVAIADSLAASAAYWIGCAAGEFYVTPGGEVGSIGVWSAHQNIAKHLELLGVDITLISAGKFKTEGHPYSSLEPEAKDFMQKRVDEYYGMFANAVAKGRGVPIAQVREHMGQGRVLGAADAAEEKMVDGVMTFQEVVKKMQRDGKSARTPGRSARANARAIEILSL
jgi:signal peptide peptidase SppA